MPSRFDKKEDKPTVLTPQLMEAVARQAERRRVEALERETREASLVQDVADRLGVEPAEVRAMAHEEARKRAAPKGQMVRWPLSRGTLHAAYLAGLAIVGAWGVAGRVGPKTPLPFLQPPTIAVPPRSAIQETIPMDPTLVSPPMGFKISVMGDRTIHSVAGLQGKASRAPATAAALKKSIRALLRWEEASYGTLLAFQESGTTSPVTGVKRAAAAPGGWHRVEITNGSTTDDALLPDRRFASDFKDFEREFNAAVDEFVDQRYLPRLAKEVPSTPLPDPTSVPVVPAIPAAPKAPATPLTEKIVQGVERLNGLRRR